MYSGSTNNLKQRELLHNKGLGSKYVRSRGGGVIIYSEEFETRGQALRREAELKKMTRRQKNELVKKFNLNLMQKQYYGEQTEKALKNFDFDVYRVHKEFIQALVKIKKATALANFEDQGISVEIKNAIVKACDEILSGKLSDQFPLKALQGGAGTSTHMNVNEVVATRATEILSEAGKNIKVHPNDHVNRGQSTNDANPSAIKVAAFVLAGDLINSLELLAKALEKKSNEFKNIPKLARTHLQDAIPTTLGAEFGSYAAIVRRHEEKIRQTSALMLDLNLGGTAIGNSANASGRFVKALYKNLNKITGLKFKPGKNLMSLTSSQTDFLAMSQAITAAALDISKIASDLRLLSSGPNGGLGEITLPELQKGSSIMPGKVNPVMPEAVNQLYFLISGNNLTIEHAAHAAQLELGVMFPTIADRLLQSLKLTAQVAASFTSLCINGIKANKERARELLEKSTAYATLLNPVLGYDTMTEIVKESVKTGKTIRSLVLDRGLLSEAEFNKFTKI